MAGPQRAPFIWPWEGQGLREALWRIGGPQPCWEIIIWGLRSFYEVWDNYLRLDSTVKSQKWESLQGAALSEGSQDSGHRVWVHLRGLSLCLAFFHLCLPSIFHLRGLSLLTSLVHLLLPSFLPSSFREVWAELSLVFFHVLSISFFLTCFHLPFERLELSSVLSSSISCPPLSIFLSSIFSLETSTIWHQCEVGVLFYLFLHIVAYLQKNGHLCMFLLLFDPSCLTASNLSLSLRS